MLVLRWTLFLLFWMARLATGGCRQAWQRQQLRLMLLCGSLLGSRQPAKLGPDMRWDLTESAAARLLWSLTHWQSDRPGTEL